MGLWRVDILMGVLLEWWLRLLLYCSLETNIIHEMVFFQSVRHLVKWRRCIQRSENHPSSINMLVVSRIFLVSTASWWNDPIWPKYTFQNWVETTNQSMCFPNRCRNYFEATDGLIWVVDSADRQRLEDLGVRGGRSSFGKKLVQLHGAIYTCNIHVFTWFSGKLWTRYCIL